MATSTDYDEHTSECQDCCKILSLYKQLSVLPNILNFHVNYLVIRERKSKMKLKAREHLQRMINALQNSKGGAILIHFKGVDRFDRSLEFLDEFIYNIFPAVAEDGSLISDMFTRGWLCNVKEFQYNWEFAHLVISPLPHISTMMVNTKVRTDLDNVNATNRCILKLLNCSQHHTEIPKIRGLDFQGECEDRHREYKSIHHMHLMPSTHDLAEYIWRDLRMRENVTSMSKQVGGGSYYVGISEKEVMFGKYRSKVPEIIGFEKNMDKNYLKECLLKLSQKDLVLLTLKEGFTQAPTDLFEIVLHSVEHNRYVLEVAVRYLPGGVVFYDNQGPCAFHLKNGVIVRMTKEEWFHRLKIWDASIGPSLMDC